MTIPLFKSFLSTITPWRVGEIAAQYRVLEHPVTGAPTGLQSKRANGTDGIWGLIDLTPAQVNAPSAAMIADLNATYRLNEAPYTRYQSNGVSLDAMGGDNGQMDIIPSTGVFGNMIIYSPFTVTIPQGVTIQGNVHVINFPA